MSSPFSPCSTERSEAVLRMLTNLKFWALTTALVWVVVVTVIIATNPEFARGTG
ncbi:hypothetical protein SaccyDRAFT_0769 [Saccharomonospora cyanea NA-134]|uniref:Uncharacterized protein n=1 Tax=Saccharomonospora cyanea NA-134 TaxID=882082 RepID=H5XJE2_9PSEU|nr:hypothetical protein SaccyDRAFT_0769 [Saccharomonospora cyanea NA-134]